MISKPQIPNGSPAPTWWQKIQYTRRPLAYMDAANKRYGDIFNAPVIGNHPVVLFVSNPQALQSIFTDGRHFTSPPNQLMQPVVGDYSIFTLEGSRHLRERKLLMPPFHGERMQTYGQLICQLVDETMRDLSVGSVFSARHLAQQISLEVILQVVFGIYQGERCQQLKSSIVQLTDSLQSLFVGGLLFFPALQKDWGRRSPWGYFRDLQRQISELLYAEIRERRSQERALGSDILSLLISARDETGKPMTDVELHDELTTLLLAGHETTASAIAWALYWVHRQAQVNQKLLAELNGLAKNPEPTAIADLPYLTAVCHETLRIFPVAILTVPREVKEAVELMGYQLEPGMRLYGCIYLTHRRSDLYPQPESFQPERFLKRQFSPYEFLPFGGGTRRCLGEALAQFEMKLVLATILSRYRLALADRDPEYPQRRGVTFAPARGVPMVLKEKL